MKNWGLKILVGAILVAVALWLRGRGPQTPTSSEAQRSAQDNQRSARASRPRRPAGPDWNGPSRVVNDFFQAAADGDDEAYLRLVDGQLRRTLDQNREELGADAFRESLRRSTAGIKGLAVTPADDTSGTAVTLDVEIVFADRNENQRIVLVPKGRGWVITTIDQARRVEPAVPYGTPVFEGISSEKKQGS